MTDLAALRDQLVDGLEAAGHVRSPGVAEAFRAVPRHAFLPGVEPELAYRDEALPTKWDAAGRPISSSSQPAIMAIMLEQLAVEPGHRVLEIGAGTGYNAALLGQLAGEVVSVDIDADLVAGARRHLAACGLARRVTVERGDGGFGWPPRAPYDRIILTVAAADIAPAWIEQLGPSGRLVLPLSLRGAQRSIAFERVDGRLESRSTRFCGFMPLRGAFARVETAVALGPGLFVDTAAPRQFDAPALHAALRQPGPEVATGAAAAESEVWDGLALWLALHEPDLARLYAFEDAPGRALMPSLVTSPTQAFTFAVVGDRALAALTGQPLAARAFGPGGDALAERLAAQVRAWDAAGRPGTADLRVTVHPPGTAEAQIRLPHADLALEWAPLRARP